MEARSNTGGSAARRDADAEEGVRLSPVHVELALEAGQLGVWEFDIQRGVVTWSPTLECIHGIPVGSFEGTFEAYQRDVHPDDRELVMATIRRSLAGEPHLLEYRIVRPDGAVRWLSARGRLERDAEGRPMRLVGVCMDITDRKASEVELRVSRTWLSTVLSSIGDAVVTTDATGAITLMNPVAETLAGVSLDQVRGRPLTEVFCLVDEATRTPIENPVVQVLRERRVVGLAQHTLLLRGDGSELAIDDSAAPIRGADGEIAGVVMVFSDVTERRQEERRREFAAEATAILAGSLDYTTTLETVTRLAVPKIADWCAVDLLIGASLERVGVAHVDPEKLAFAHEIHRRFAPELTDDYGVGAVVRTGRAELVSDVSDARLVAAIRDPELVQSIRALSMRSTMVVPMCHQGVVLGAITFVTSSRRLEGPDLQLGEELANCAAIAIQNARLYADAQRNLQAREQFLAMVSHDLRNPLQLMMMKTSLLEERLSKREAAVGPEDLQTIKRAGRRMDRLIGDLLDFARIDEGQLQVDCKPHDADELLAQAVDALASLGASKSIRALREGSARGVTVICDRERVLQLFENLISNAVKFTPEGGTVTIGVDRRDDELVFCVSDDGPGISEADREHLFDRYWRAREKNREGLGLGLFIAKGIAEAHGGRIWVESTRGQGASFSFTLPLQ